MAGERLLMPASESTEFTLLALFDFEGEYFVEQVYLFFLGRPPDESGRLYYTDRLRRNYSKSSIIVQILKSDEATAYQAAHPQLKAAVEQWFKRSAPLSERLKRLWRSRSTGRHQLARRTGDSDGAGSGIMAGPEISHAIQKLSANQQQMAVALENFGALIGPGKDRQDLDRLKSCQMSRQALHIHAKLIAFTEG